MSSETRRHLSSLNESLRAEYSNLKATKDDLIDHISTLLKREKQLATVKIQLSDELVKAEQLAVIDRRQKSHQCAFLRDQLKQLDRKIIDENIKLKNLQNEYQVCLQDYDKVLATITSLLEGATNIDNQLQRLKQSDTTMKSMIFDCERLKRVLEDERKYFKQLSNAENKSHGERLVEMESIKRKLIQEQTFSNQKSKQTKIRLGFIKLCSCFTQKIRLYSEQLLRNEFKTLQKMRLGIKVFTNCLQIGTMKSRQAKKKFFTRWHNKTFPKNVLANIVQNALAQNIESKIKLKYLNSMSEKINSNSLSVLHLFQKIKYIIVASNASFRKAKHCGFNKWRQNCHDINKIDNQLSNIMTKTLPKLLVRAYYKKWRNNAVLAHRFATAELLLSQFDITKQLARVFRKWRFQVPSCELTKINSFIFNIKLRNKITSRLNYEKRKVKIITLLQAKMIKIKLRNYFIRYWKNSKQFQVKEVRQSIEENRQKFGEMRKQNSILTAAFKEKDKILMVNIFKKFVLKIKLNPYFKQWKNDSKHFRQQKKAIYSLVLRKQGKNKLYVMNELRKCVQYYQKKEMHQILTDLNHKMQEINQKSTKFREMLKNCIQNLGIVASKKIDYIMAYAQKYQKRMLFNKNFSLVIKKAFKSYLLDRMLTILHLSCERQTFSSLIQNSKQVKKDKILAQKQIIYAQKAKTRKLKDTFFSLKRLLQCHKNGFSKLIHIQNVLMFYRMTWAFAAVKRKYVAEDIKFTKKKLLQTIGILDSKKQNYHSLDNTKKGLEESLKRLFGKFIQFQDRNQNIKKLKSQGGAVQKYFHIYRDNIKEQKFKEQVMINFSDMLQYKNLFIFWKGILTTKYQKLSQDIKDQLGKINKKRKNFDQKSAKGRLDYEKRIQEQAEIHEEHLHYYNFYLKRYEDLLVFYSKKHDSIEKLNYKRQIFNAWKIEYIGTKRIFQAINRVYQRHYVKIPCAILSAEVKKYDSQYRSNLIIANLLEKKGKNQIKDAVTLWRCNVRKVKCETVDRKIHSIDQYQTNLKAELCEVNELIGHQVIRTNQRKVFLKIFMAFKNGWLKKRQNVQKVLPLRTKMKERYVKTAINGWKWLMFYKKTKRSYLKHKKQLFEKGLKRDVFLTLKIYRQEIYCLVGKAYSIYQNLQTKILRYSLDKIINVAAKERDDLNLARKRALFTIIMGKQTRQKVIKRKILAKWNAWLIPKSHYLPNILKQLELSALKKAFANINQKKYWNDYYIKGIADQVTSSGYSEVNQVTNSLMREGYDPDEIKDYLKKRNENDMQNITKVVSHIKLWATKEILVRAFHSWKQYLQLKMNIKKSLNKVFNIAGGIGKYWSRWRTKDVQFNQILKKESRDNMLNRYQDLSRLLKEYRRDIHDSEGNLKQLQDINFQYRQKNKQGIMMALTALSNNVKKGIRQGFYLWRNKMRFFRREKMDERYEQLAQGIQMFSDQRSQLKYRLAVLREQNNQLKQKCTWGVECGKILQNLLTQKDSLSIDLADKEHNLKLLLQDNLRLKQKMLIAKNHAQKLISKVEEDVVYPQ